MCRNCSLRVLVSVTFALIVIVLPIPASNSDDCVNRCKDCNVWGDITDVNIWGFCWRYRKVAGTIIEDVDNCQDSPSWVVGGFMAKICKPTGGANVETWLYTGCTKVCTPPGNAGAADWVESAIGVVTQGAHPNEAPKQCKDSTSE